jgi:hypothetical protein
MFGLEKLGAKVIAIVVLGLVVLGLAWFGLAQWRHAHTEATERRVERAQGDAMSNSAADAIATQSAAAVRERASEELGRTNSEEIHNAEGAKVEVNPAVAGAGRRALCMRDAYRDSERCKLLRAAPR